jgi:GT2 family glycosyltransferase
MNNFEKNITFVIVSFRSSHIIEKCIKSINPNIKIIIIENSDNVHIKDYLENKFLNVEVIVAKENLGLSGYIENYPLTSKMVLSQLKMIIDSIKQIKKSGGEYTDIQDHPMIKRHLDKLENFI